MNDTDTYDDRHRAPDPPPTAVAEPGSKDATPGVDPTKTALQNAGEQR